MEMLQQTTNCFKLLGYKQKVDIISQKKLKAASISYRINLSTIGIRPLQVVWLGQGVASTRLQSSHTSLPDFSHRFCICLSR